MPVYQVASRTAQVAAPPKKRGRRIPREWSAVIRVVRSIAISALLFVAILDITGSLYTFILLPVFLSLFIIGSRNYSISGPRGFNFNIFANRTPAYLLLTFCLALVYYSFITGFILLSHPTSAPIILVTVALAWAIILEPVRVYLQSFIERRFNVCNREATRAVAAFTSTLREEIDLDKVRNGLLAVVEQTMQPYSVSFWTLMMAQQQAKTGSAEEITIAGDDPIIAYALAHPGVVEVDRLQLDSPTIKYLKTNLVELALLLVSQAELIGLLTLGSRRDGQEYSHEDLSLLNSLAIQVAPALRVAQMVQQQQEQVRERERIEQELRTAQAIQHAFLPKDVPALPGWQIVPYYQPAREVAAISTISSSLMMAGWVSSLGMSPARAYRLHWSWQLSIPCCALLRKKRLLRARS